MDRLAEPKLLVATHVNVPAESVDTSAHCNVDVPLDRLAVVVVMAIEGFLLLRGSPLCIHSSEGRGIPSKLHFRVNVLLTSKIFMDLLEVVTSGASVSGKDK